KGSDGSELITDDEDGCNSAARHSGATDYAYARTVEQVAGRCVAAVARRKPRAIAADRAQFELGVLVLRASGGSSAAAQPAREPIVIGGRIADQQRDQVVRRERLLLTR